MIIFLYGPDSYRSKHKLQEIVNHYKETKKSGLNLTYFDAKEKDFSDFHDNFKISSMFAERKLIILKNIFSNKNFQEGILGEIKNLESFKDVVVIYEDNSADERTKLFKVLKKEHKSQEFTLLEGQKLKDWAQKEFSARGGSAFGGENHGAKVNADALALLINYTGNDLWRLSEEVKKLSNFKEGSVVKKEDVELLVKPRIELDIFKTIDALASKNKKQALELIHKHLEGGDNPLYLLSMIVYQFRNLLVVKELAGKGLMYASIVKKSGLHPFVVKKNYFASSQFSLDQLKHIYRNTFLVDSDIKKGKIEPETALDLLVSKI